MQALYASDGLGKERFESEIPCSCRKIYQPGARSAVRPRASVPFERRSMLRVKERRRARRRLDLDKAAGSSRRLATRDFSWKNFSTWTATAPFPPCFNFVCRRTARLPPPRALC